MRPAEIVTQRGARCTLRIPNRAYWRWLVRSHPLVWVSA